MSQQNNSLTRLALQKFKKNFWGVFSLGIIACIGFISVFAYLFAPDASKNANQMHLSIHSQSPGFKVEMLTIPSGIKSNQNFLSKLFFGKTNTDTEIPIQSYKVNNDIFYYTEYASDGLQGLEKQINISRFPNSNYKEYIESRSFAFGTDKYGRDYLSRVLIGSRISFFIGFVAVFISLIVGLLFGSLAGYYGGKVDAFIMWIINITWSIPTLLLVIAITLALGKGFWQVFIAVGLTMWVEVARVVRGQIISAKEMQYVTAARALGYNDYRIITKHILPNIFGPLIVISAANTRPVTRVPPWHLPPQPAPHHPTQRPSAPPPPHPTHPPLCAAALSRQAGRLGVRGLLALWADGAQHPCQVPRAHRARRRRCRRRRARRARRRGARGTA